MHPWRAEGQCVREFIPGDFGPRRNPYCISMPQNSRQPFLLWELSPRIDQGSKETSYSSPNGQPNSSCIPIKNGGDTVTGTSRDSLRPMGICSEEGISLTAEYLPGEMNHEADWQSRHFRDSSNWKLNPKVFHTIDQLWVTLTIDLCADCMSSWYFTLMMWKSSWKLIHVSEWTVKWRPRWLKSNLFPDLFWGIWISEQFLY